MDNESTIWALDYRKQPFDAIVVAHHGQQVCVIANERLVLLEKDKTFETLEAALVAALQALHSEATRQLTDAQRISDQLTKLRLTTKSQ